LTVADETDRLSANVEDYQSTPLTSHKSDDLSE
jgi:hypothetical protein